MSGPLSGLRVLDLTTVVLGPYATQIFGDYGADVIKIERPGGDPNRYMTPGRNRGMSGISMTLNRNKRSVVLDLKDTDDRERFYGLVKTADIVIHNMLPKVVNTLGLDYNHLSKINPSIIYCVATGFAEGGPYADKPAYDDLIQGTSGVANLMESINDEPRYFPGIICDKVTGLTAVNAVLAAMVYRERTGKGQKVSVPMFETMIAFNLSEHAADALFTPSESQYGYKRLLSQHRRPYKTANGYICALPYSDRDWREFFIIVGQNELISDSRFSEMRARSANIDTLYKIVSRSMPERTTEDWLNCLQEKNIPAMPVINLTDIEKDPHIEATGFFQHREHPSEGKFREIGIPVQFSVSKTDVPSPAPKLGQHNEDIFG